MKNEQGSALFLILIAVALFAALSYAVTQSGRGEGNIDRETLELKTAELIRQSAMFQSYIRRAHLIDGIDQVRFTQASENASGTVCLPDRTTNTGTTIGIFNQDGSGLPLMFPPAEVTPNGAGSNAHVWNYFFNGIVEVGGGDIGTSDGDEFFRVSVNKAACKIINIQTYSANTILLQVSFIPGCHEPLVAPGSYHFFDLVEAH